MWRENGFEIVGQAISYRSAISYIRSSGAELVVCFEKPPELDAVRLTESLTELNGPLCIVVSPDSSSERIRQCFLSGAVDYLTGPVSVNALADSLQTALKKLKSVIRSTEYRIAADEYFGTLEEKVVNGTFLKNLKAFIADNEDTVVSTQTAAEYFGFNKDYFGRMFRSEIGMTFGEFYKRFRMVYAERLLKTGRYRVHEVSDMLGFSTADYFTSEFKKYTGMKPLDVRKREKP